MIHLTSILQQSQLNRIPDAIDAGVDRVTEPTFGDGQATDIPEDFRFDEETVEVTVPAGAQYLFVSNADSKQSDNSATLAGFKVEITR
ncbi:MAG: hypothetical protein HKN43_05990 [Rhodothermales bacterium]|nr:hypothetical protein [Rhodothermales bacterium]